MVHNLNGLLEFGYFLGHCWSEMERIEAVVVVGLYHHTYWKAQTEIHYLLEQIEVADSTYSLQLVGEEAVKFFGLDSLYLEVVRRLAAVVFFRPRWVVLVGARKAAIPALAAVYFHMVKMVFGCYWWNALCRELLCHQYSPCHKDYFHLYC